MGRDATTRSTFTWALQFLRPSFIALAICLAVGIFCWTALQYPPGGLDSMEALGFELPRPDLTAREVVQIQLNGLASTEPGNVGVFQCYCFAAPANRIVTGPFARFSQMVKAFPFDILGNNLSLSIGSELTMGHQRRVLVSAVGHDRQLHLFVFVLQRQTASPFQDCWMTMGVIPLDLSPAVEQESVLEA